MAKSSEAPRSIAEKFLAQTESTALYGGKPGETIQELKPETRQEIATLLDHEAARLFAEEKAKKEKTAKRVLSVDEVVTTGSNLEALMHLALLYKDEEANQEISHNQQAAALKVLRGMQYELLVQNGLRLNPTEVELKNLSAEAKEHYARLKGLQGEVFTNITGWTPEAFFDQEAVEKELGAWRQDYEQQLTGVTGFARRVYERILTGKYIEKEAAKKEELIAEQKEEAEWKFFDVEMIRFEKAQRSIYRGRQPLHEQGEVIESIKHDLALERRAMYAELLTGEKKKLKPAAEKVLSDAVESADEILKSCLENAADVPHLDEDEFNQLDQQQRQNYANLGIKNYEDLVAKELAKLYGADSYENELKTYLRKHGGTKRAQAMRSEPFDLFKFWLEWYTDLIDLKNR